MPRKQRKSHFGGETKAVDGLLATLLLDGKTIVRHFDQHLDYRGTRSGYKRRVIKTPKESSIYQLIDYCDRTGARIISISSPETILRDLQGTRANLEQRPQKQTRDDVVFTPERTMLRGRQDLLV